MVSTAAIRSPAFEITSCNGCRRSLRVGWQLVLIGHLDEVCRGSKAQAQVRGQSSLSFL